MPLESSVFHEDRKVNSSEQQYDKTEINKRSRSLFYFNLLFCSSKDF